MSPEKELEFKHLQDSNLKIIAHDLEFAEYEKFEILDDLVYRKGSDHLRFVVLESMVSNIIRVP